MHHTLGAFSDLYRSHADAVEVAENRGFVTQPDGSIVRDWFGTLQRAEVTPAGGAWRLTHP